MATIILNNPSKEQVIEFIDSKTHFIESSNIILAMSDLKRWFKKYNNLNEFLYLENGYTLCQVEKDEEIYSEEGTLIN